MPDFPIPAGYASSDDYLTQLAQEGLERRYGSVDPAVQERLDYELSVITSQDFSGYFLIVWDLVNYARNQSISVGPGRGLGRWLLGLVLPRHYQCRSDQVRPAIRALPQSRTH